MLGTSLISLSALPQNPLFTVRHVCLPRAAKVRWMRLRISTQSISHHFFKAVPTKSTSQDRHFESTIKMTDAYPPVAQPDQKSMMNSGSVANRRGERTR